MSRTFALLLLFVAPLVARSDDVPKTLTPAETRKAFRTLLDRPRVEPDVKELPGIASGSVATFSFTFASEKKARRHGRARARPRSSAG